ncbi:MAG: hypothetical protein J0I65_18550 [Variovorax sp.]|nr:hypothetical protein [Variovorax sp.]|tara:strand:+ start:489 stop:860 length:372 start_codon:yes stop_codon:yes gene_type:complete
MNAVHTCALPGDESDLFAGTDAAPPTSEMLKVPGVLTRDAEVRVKPVGHDGHALPVLCLDMAPLSGRHRSIHAEIPFREGERKQAEQLASTLKRGAHVSITTPVDGMRTIFPHVQAVALTPSH